MLRLLDMTTLIKDSPNIEKCLFVVDRKAHGRQTREDWSSSVKTSSKEEARRVSDGRANQFNGFHEACVGENPNTAALVRRLLSEDLRGQGPRHTTIQKLGLALDDTSKRNRKRKKNDQPSYKEMLAPLPPPRSPRTLTSSNRAATPEPRKSQTK